MKMDNNMDKIIVEIGKDSNASEEFVKKVVDIVSSYMNKTSAVAGFGVRLPDNRKAYPTYPAEALDKLEVSLNVEGGIPPVGTTDGPTIAGA